MRTGFSLKGKKRFSPDGKGDVLLSLNELERIEIDLGEKKPEGVYSGYMKVGETLRRLPVGSKLDGERGVFYWQPGPAFYGQYEFVFIREGEERSRQNIKIRIGKADSQWDEDFKIPSPEYGREPLVEGSDSAVQDTKSISSYQEGIASSRTSPKGSIIPLGSSGVTYYIHSYDGKVLAEYDQNGNCVRDYIYVVDLLRAEYRPLEAKYYYYTSDQVNSVRVVTKDAGNAVYVAAYSPYGKIQEEWVPTYQPSLKFSGKERETNSEVDYFGARYYNHKHYRFLSVDPVINREEALSNPQLWNLYAFCRNNPVTFLDPTGEYGIDVHYYMTYYLAKQAGFSERDAIMISRANQFIDENPSTDSTRIRIKNLKQTMEMWHFASEQRVAEVLSNAYESGDLNMLGTALHVLQDSLYAHKGYKAPFGHVVDTLLGRNPDETFRDVEKALEMAQQTLNVLTRFRGVESKKIDKGFLRNYFKTREIEDKIDMIK